MYSVVLMFLQILRTKPYILRRSTADMRFIQMLINAFYSKTSKIWMRYLFTLYLSHLRIRSVPKSSRRSALNVDLYVV